MTNEEKIKYMRISCAICGYDLSQQGVDLLVSMYELILEKRGATDLHSIAKVEIGAAKREKQRNIKVKLSKNPKPQ